MIPAMISTTPSMLEKGSQSRHEDVSIEYRSMFNYLSYLTYTTKVVTTREIKTQPGFFLRNYGELNEDRNHVEF